MSDKTIAGNGASLCDASLCPMCGAQCDRKIDHEGQHHCINCGCRWTEEDFLEDANVG